MTILTFSWNDVGMANDITVTEICHTARTGYAAGYQATRAQATKMQKQFNVFWTAMKFEEWLNLVEFWRSVYGSANAFYWEFPLEMYDVGAFGGDDMGEEDPGGWDSEGDGMGFGAGPVFLVRFLNDELPQKYKHVGRWIVSAVLAEVA